MSKMKGVSVALPLVVGNRDGPYQLNKTFRQSAKQNFKNLLLTASGERVMLPDFGVGLKTFLFEQMNSNTYQKITEEISKQSAKYTPYINLSSVEFVTNDQDPALAFNQVKVVVKYHLGDEEAADTLAISSQITN
jgi:phage baseplate assembly protein W